VHADDLRDPNTPEPTAADESGRSSQIFYVDVVVRKNGEERRASARGRDIYAITAPIVAEAVGRVLDGRAKATGVVAAGQAFDAREFLMALSRSHLTSRSVREKWEVRPQAKREGPCEVGLKPPRQSKPVRNRSENRDTTKRFGRVAQR
jgi:hypothetical protein